MIYHYDSIYSGQEIDEYLSKGKNSASYLQIPHLTPEQYGAIGDGVNDDSDCFQECLNDSMKNSIPVIASKTYLITKPLETSYDLIINGKIIYAGYFENCRNRVGEAVCLSILNHGTDEKEGIEETYRPVYNRYFKINLYRTDPQRNTAIPRNTEGQHSVEEDKICGVKFYNCTSCNINIPKIDNFYYGIIFEGRGRFCDANSICVENISNFKYGLVLCAARTPVKRLDSLRKGTTDENMFYHIGYFVCDKEKPENPEQVDDRIFYRKDATGIFLSSRYSQNRRTFTYGQDNQTGYFLVKNQPLDWDENNWPTDKYYSYNKSASSENIYTCLTEFTPFVTKTYYEKVNDCFCLNPLDGFTICSEDWVYPYNNLTNLTIEAINGNSQIVNSYEIITVEPAYNEPMFSLYSHFYLKPKENNNELELHSGDKIQVLYETEYEHGNSNNTFQGGFLENIKTSVKLQRAYSNKFNDIRTERTLEPLSLERYSKHNIVRCAWGNNIQSSDKTAIANDYQYYQERMNQNYLHTILDTGDLQMRTASSKLTYEIPNPYSKNENDEFTLEPEIIETEITSVPGLTSFNINNKKNYFNNQIINGTSVFEGISSINEDGLLLGTNLDTRIDKEFSIEYETKFRYAPNRYYRVKEYGGYELVSDLEEPLDWKTGHFRPVGISYELLTELPTNWTEENWPKYTFYQKSENGEYYKLTDYISYIKNEYYKLIDGKYQLLTEDIAPDEWIQENWPNIFYHKANAGGYVPINSFIPYENEKFYKKTRGSETRIRYKAPDDWAKWPENKYYKIEVLTSYQNYQPNIYYIIENQQYKLLTSSTAPDNWTEENWPKNTFYNSILLSSWVSYEAGKYFMKEDNNLIQLTSTQKPEDWKSWPENKYYKRIYNNGTFSEERYLITEYEEFITDSGRGAYYQYNINEKPNWSLFIAQFDADNNIITDELPLSDYTTSNYTFSPVNVKSSLAGDPLIRYFRRYLGMSGNRNGAIYYSDPNSTEQDYAYTGPIGLNEVFTKVRKGLLTIEGLNTTSSNVIYIKTSEKAHKTYVGLFTCENNIILNRLIVKSKTSNIKPYKKVEKQLVLNLDNDAGLFYNLTYLNNNNRILNLSDVKDVDLNYFNYYNDNDIFKYWKYGQPYDKNYLSTLPCKLPLQENKIIICNTLQECTDISQLYYVLEDNKLYYYDSIWKPFTRFPLLLYPNFKGYYNNMKIYSDNSYNNGWIWNEKEQEWKAYASSGSSEYPPAEGENF